MPLLIGSISHHLERAIEFSWIGHVFIRYLVVVQLYPYKSWLSHAYK